MHALPLSSLPTLSPSLLVLGIIHAPPVCGSRLDSYSLKPTPSQETDQMIVPRHLGAHRAARRQKIQFRTRNWRQTTRNYPDVFTELVAVAEGARSDWQSMHVPSRRGVCCPRVRPSRKGSLQLPICTIYSPDYSTVVV